MTDQDISAPEFATANPTERIRHLLDYLEVPRQRLAAIQNRPITEILISDPLVQSLVLAEIAIGVRQLLAARAHFLPPIVAGETLSTAPNDGSFIDTAACGATNPERTRRCTYAAGHGGRHGWQS